METTLIDLISIEICLHFHNTRKHVNHCDPLNCVGGRRDIYAEEWRLFSTLWNAIICLKGRKKERAGALPYCQSYSNSAKRPPRFMFYQPPTLIQIRTLRAGDIAVSC